MQDLRQRDQLQIGHGPLLSLEQRQRGDAHINPGKLQLGQQVNLFHSLRQPRLRDACADEIAVAQRQLSDFHENTPNATNYMSIGG